MYLSTLCFVAMMLSVAFGQTCLRETNTARVNEGLPALKHNDRLSSAAKFHTDWMIENNCFSHQCPGEPYMGVRVNNTGYAYWSLGEILASTSGDCQNAMNMWLNSESHRNIVLGYYKDIGCNHGRTYITCVFGIPQVFEFKTSDDSSNNELSYQVIHRENWNNTVYQ